MQPKTWSWIARLMSLIAIGCVLGVSIAGLVKSKASVGSIIRLADLCFFMLLLLIAELRIKVFLKYFNFLAGPYGTIILDNSTAGLIVGGCVIAQGIAYAFICKKAEYGDQAQIQQMNKQADDEMQKQLSAK